MSKGWVIGLSLAGVAAVLTLAAIAAGAFFLVGFGLDVFADQVRREVEDNPVIVEQIGAIREIEVDFVASANESDPDVFVFRLVGSKGTGTLTARCITIDDATEQVTEARLQVASGEKLDLFPDRAAGVR